MAKHPAKYPQPAVAKPSVEPHIAQTSAQAQPLSREERFELLKQAAGSIQGPGLNAEQMRRVNMYED